MIAAALLLPLLGISSSSDIHTRADAGPLLARSALMRGLKARNGAAPRTCGLINRVREIELLDQEYTRLHQLVAPPARGTVIYGDVPIRNTGYAGACVRSAGYHAHANAYREALTVAREALGLGE